MSNADLVEIGAFRATEIGSLPEDWSVAALGQVAHVYSGGTPSRSRPEYWGPPVPWVTTAEVNFGEIHSTKEQITLVGLNNSAATVAPSGTLLIAMYGQGKTRGKTAILGVDAAMNQACAAIEPGVSLSARYLFHYLVASYDRIRILSNTGNQENLSGKLVKKILVPVPPKSEQTRIESFLDDADSLIWSLMHVIAKKESIKQGVIQQLLMGKTRLSGFGETWSAYKLDELGLFLKGYGIKRDDVQTSGIACIRYGELYTTYRDYTSTTVSFVTPSVAATALPIHQGDLLFAGSGETRNEIGIGIAFTGTQRAVAGGDIVVLRAPDVNPVYLASLINTPIVAARKARLGQGDAVVHISSRALSSIEVDLPPRDEQDAIAQVLVDADNEIRALKVSLVKVRRIKQGMMQELLTGRTRLPVAEVVRA